MTEIINVIQPRDNRGNDASDFRDDPDFLSKCKISKIPDVEVGLVTELHDTSEDGLALTFADNTHDLKWLETRHKWMMWNGMVWEEDSRLTAFSRIRTLCRNIADTLDQEKEARTITVLKKSSTVAAVEKLSHCDPRLITTEIEFDSDKWLLNTEGGIANLLTREITPHDPDKMMTKVAHGNPFGDCPRWLQFLGEVTNNRQDLIDYLQRIVGYCLTGSVREHALFFFYGTGRNGKGVFLNTLQSLLGEYACNAAIETMMESKGDRHPTELAMFKGKRLVVAQEVDEGGKWAEAKIKMLTGGDPITARFMRGDFFTFTPEFKLLIAGNHKPEFRNVDEAMRGRLNLIPFTVTIPKEKRDPELPKKLESEFNGILRWALDGCAKYMDEGLCPPEVVTTATNEYFMDENIFLQWVSECCVVGEGNWDTSARLFQSWQKFATLNGFTVGDNKAFKKKMEGEGFYHKKMNVGQTFQGLKLK